MTPQFDHFIFPPDVAQKELEDVPPLPARSVGERLNTRLWINGLVQHIPDAEPPRNASGKIADPA